MGNALLAVLKFPLFHFLEEYMSEAGCLPRSLLPSSLSIRNGHELPGGGAVTTESSALTPLDPAVVPGPHPPVGPVLGERTGLGPHSPQCTLAVGVGRQGGSRNLSVFTLIVKVENHFRAKRGVFCGLC